MKVSDTIHLLKYGTTEVLQYFYFMILYTSTLRVLKKGSVYVFCDFFFCVNDEDLCKMAAKTVIFNNEIF